ncbi:MAG: SDR family NAD(P)-dependent oxidoreductase [Alphaproteobacteria bacterium]
MDILQTSEVAFVTGAASGIGRAVTFRLAARGAAVALVDLDARKLEPIVRELEARGVRTLALACDVSSSDSVATAIGRTVGEFGGIDTAVCAAGIARTGDVISAPEDDWHRTLAVNLTGTYLVARHAIAHLSARKGSFVAISSDAGVRGSTGFAAYCASKHGVIGLVRCLALDHGPQGVRANVVCPSFVDTPMADQLLAAPGVQSRAFYERRTPAGRFAQPEEVANVIAHLSSGEASYTNGMVYIVDGGTTAGMFEAKR